MVSLEHHDQVKQVMNHQPLCDYCLGRYVRKKGSAQDTAETGERIRKQLGICKKVPPSECWLCEGLLDEIPHFASLLIDELSSYEFDSFLLGAKIEEGILEKEQRLISQLKVSAEDQLKLELNRRIGTLVENSLKKEVCFNAPEIMAILDTQFDVITLQIKSLYLYGRYKKLQRGIPQTKWYCPICRGHGCRKCSYTGTLYDTSVEELVSYHALQVTNGTDAVFHGSGREDIDARMLGTGRPFILEIKNPQIRTFSVKDYERNTNSYAKGRVEIHKVKFTKKSDISRLKSLDAKKQYQITISGEHTFDGEKLKEQALLLQGSTIQQYTPTRVAHRRADKLRKRKIYHCQVTTVKGTQATLILETESGTYIKELISGDNGRTTPNLSDLIGFPCKVETLDVLAVKGD